jgi:hypothetical protein
MGIGQQPPVRLVSPAENGYSEGIAVGLEIHQQVVEECYSPFPIIIGHGAL